MKRLTLALDWTPNINHIGFFVAKEKGFYIDENIALEILNPSQDNYKTTPAKKVELGEADFALCPFESILSYQTKSTPFPLKAVATIFKEDLSAIVVHKNSGINTPKDLEGKSYASYKAKYEDEIVKQLIKNDGGNENLQLVYPKKLGIWETILNKSYDSTWVFVNWEGVLAKNHTDELRYFKLKDYNIPYSYSPVIATNGNAINSSTKVYKDFLSATKKGYLYSKENPKEACKILYDELPEYDKEIDLKEALSQTVTAFGTENNWGIMEENNVLDFLNWLKKNQLETTSFKLKDLLTNSLLY